MEVDQQSPSEPLLSGATPSSTGPREPGAARAEASPDSSVPAAGATARRGGGASASGGAATTGGAVAGRASPSEDTRFECNICLEQVNEPVVTLCGHLFCWPCLYRWLNSNHNVCPVCKAGVSKDNVIPLYGRGSEQVDPRTKPRADDDVPGRPAAQRPEARPQPQAQAFMGGIPVMNTFGNNQFGANGMSFSAGFGFFPSLFGLQFQTFASTVPPPAAGPHAMNPDEAQQAFLSRLLLMLGIFVIMCLLMF